VGFSNKQRIFEIDIFSSKSSKNEFSSERFNLNDFVGTDQPEVFESFESKTIELWREALGKSVFDVGKNGRNSLAAFIGIKIVSIQDNFIQGKTLRTGPVVSLVDGSVEGVEHVVVESHGLLRQFGLEILGQLEGKTLRSH